MSQEPDALIVGGGIAGLSAALALRQAGVEATVYEKAPELREVGAGIGLWPNATRALRRLGVLGAVEEKAGRTEAVAIQDPGGRTLMRFRVRGDAPGLCVHRAELLDALREALPASAVRTGHTLVGFADDGATVHAQFDGERSAPHTGSSASGRLLVGADGLRSMVRETLVGDGAPRYSGMTVWRAVGPMPRAHVPGEAVEMWGDGLRFGRFGMGQGRAYWYAVENRPAGEARDAPDVQKAALLEAFRRWTPSVAEAIEATPAGAILRHDVFDRCPTRGWARGRAVLVGDAAHPATPDIGQSGALALEDAVALADHLAVGGHVDEALQAFARARYRRTALIVRQSRFAGRLGQASGTAGRLRNAASRVTPSVAFGALFSWPFRAVV